MDWLSKRKFVILCHEKVVRIPLEGDGILRVQGERTLGATKALMNDKIDKPRISDIPVVRFTDLFLKELVWATPQRQVKFRIDLVPRAMPVAKTFHEPGLQTVRGKVLSLYSLKDIQAYSMSKENINVHLKLVLESQMKEKLYFLKLVLELLRNEKLYAKVTYLRFIANFSKIVKPLTSLTERNQKYEWGAEREEAFQTLKNDLCDASINRM
ncbi:hypothetical protein Tco_0215993 [Tanacetum coccineum]